MSVIIRYRDGSSNFRTTFSAMISRAGLTARSRLFQSLQSNGRQNENNRFPHTLSVTTSATAQAVTAKPSADNRESLSESHAMKECPIVAESFERTLPQTKEPFMRGSEISLPNRTG
jgi:hypothetical protein